MRCCSLDGGSCKSYTPDCSSLTFLEAQQKCINFGMRLCSEQELSSNICCGTGCWFSLELVWHTKGNMFCSSIKILMLPCPTWVGVMFPCLVLWFNLILCSDLKIRWLHCRYIGRIYYDILSCLIWSLHLHIALDMMIWYFTINWKILDSKFNVL